MQDCACIDFYNRCDEHKDLVVGENLLNGKKEVWSTGAMDAIPNPADLNSPRFESGHIPETDAMGREKFWEDLGRQDD